MMLTSPIEAAAEKIELQETAGTGTRTRGTTEVGRIAPVETAIAVTGVGGIPEIREIIVSVTVVETTDVATTAVEEMQEGGSAESGRQQ
jgi:hypothetical protein